MLILLQPKPTWKGKLKSEVMLKEKLREAKNLSSGSGDPNMI